MAKTTQEILKATADYIQENGWCQGQASKGKAVCTSTAIDRVTDHAHLMDNRQDMPPRLMLMAYLESSGAFDGLERNSIILWNDHPGRTKDEVVSAIRKAAI